MLEPFNFIYVTRANVTFTMTDRLPGFISYGLTYRAGDTTRGRFYDEGNLTSSSQGGAGGGVCLELEIFTPDTGYDHKRSHRRIPNRFKRLSHGHL